MLLDAADGCLVPPPPPPPPLAPPVVSIDARGSGTAVDDQTAFFGFFDRRLVKLAATV